MFTDYGEWVVAAPEETPKWIRDGGGSSYRQGDLDLYEAIAAGHFSADVFFRVIDGDVVSVSTNMDAIQGVGQFVGVTGPDAFRLAEDFAGWADAGADLQQRFLWRDGEVRQALPCDLPVTARDVNDERQRRMLAGSRFTLQDGLTVYVAGDKDTKENLQGLAFAAQLRIAGGAGDVITKYRDEANDMHDLTQMQVLELWQLGSAYISDVIAASWPLKSDPGSIPVDYRDDSYWPARSLP